MRKTLQDLAEYLQTILVPGTDTAYAVDPAYAQVMPEADIRAGVRALRGFLARMLDALAASGDAYDVHQKVAHEYENRTTLSGYYPFLHNINTLLIGMGYHGVLAEGGEALACGNAVFAPVRSMPKLLACLRFLRDCGLGIDGIDLDDKKQKMADIGTVIVTYPEDPAVLMGMKIMAIAEVDHRTLLNQDVFLRCDYRALMRDTPDPLDILRDTIVSLPQDIQAFALSLHQHYLDQGLACAVVVKGYHVHVKYTYRRKDVWGLNASLNNGFHINVKADGTEEYPDTVKTLPPVLRELIAKGYGCGRKRAIGRCDGGCRGMPIPLDDAALAMGDDIVRWLDAEVAWLKGK